MGARRAPRELVDPDPGRDLARAWARRVGRSRGDRRHSTGGSSRVPPEGGGDTGGVKLEAIIDRVEALGSTVLGFFTVDAAPVTSESIAEATGGGLEEVCAHYARGHAVLRDVRGALGRSDG